VYEIHEDQASNEEEKNRGDEDKDLKRKYLHHQEH
jgi:hypothetical protein